MAEFATFDDLLADPGYQALNDAEKNRAERNLGIQYQEEGASWDMIQRAQLVGTMANAGVPDEDMAEFTKIRAQRAAFEGPPDPAGDQTLDALIESGKIAAYNAWDKGLSNIEQINDADTKSTPLLQAEGLEEPLVEMKNVRQVDPDKGVYLTRMAGDGPDQWRKIETSGGPPTEKDLNPLLKDQRNVIREQMAERTERMRATSYNAPANYAADMAEQRKQVRQLQAIDEAVGAEGGWLRVGAGGLASGVGQSVSGLGGALEAVAGDIPAFSDVAEEIKGVGGSITPDRTALERENAAAGALGIISQAGGQLAFQMAMPGLGAAGKGAKLASFGLTGASIGAGQTYEDAKAAGQDDASARKEAASVFATTAILEAAAGWGFGLLDDAAKGVMRRTLTGGFTEGSTEVFQTLAELKAQDLFRGTDAMAESLGDLYEAIGEADFKRLNDNPIYGALIGGAGAGAATGGIRGVAEGGPPATSGVPDSPEIQNLRDTLDSLDQIIADPDTPEGQRKLARAEKKKQAQVLVETLANTPTTPVADAGKGAGATTPVDPNTTPVDPNEDVEVTVLRNGLEKAKAKLNDPDLNDKGRAIIQAEIEKKQAALDARLAIDQVVNKGSTPGSTTPATDTADKKADTTVNPKDAPPVEPVTPVEPKEVDPFVDDNGKPIPDPDIKPDEKPAPTGPTDPILPKVSIKQSPDVQKALKRYNKALKEGKGADPRVVRNMANAIFREADKIARRLGAKVTRGDGGSWVNGGGDQQLRFHLSTQASLDSTYVRPENKSFGAARKAIMTVGEELIHLVDRKLETERWNKLKAQGQFEGTYQAFREWETKETFRDLRDAMDKAPEDVKRRMLQGLEGGLVLYYHKKVDNMDEFLDLLAEGNVSLAPNMLAEFGRQIIQLRNEGRINETTSRGWLSKIRALIQKYVRRLRDADRVLQDEGFDTMLAERLRGLDAEYKKVMTEGLAQNAIDNAAVRAKRAATLAKNKKKKLEAQQKGGDTTTSETGQTNETPTATRGRVGPEEGRDLQGPGVGEQEDQVGEAPDAPVDFNDIGDERPALAAGGVARTILDIAPYAATRGPDSANPRLAPEDFSDPAAITSRADRVAMFQAAGLKPILEPNQMRDNHIGSGVESDVYLSRDGKRVYKFGDNEKFESIGTIAYQAQQAELANRIFGDDIRVEGYDSRAGQLVFSQPYVKSDTPYWVDVNRAAENAGWTGSTKQGVFLSADNLWTMFDTGAQNWVYDENQKRMFPIDVHIRFEGEATRMFSMTGKDIPDTYLSDPYARSGLEYLDSMGERLGRPVAPFEFPYQEGSTKPENFDIGGEVFEQKDMKIGGTTVTPNEDTRSYPVEGGGLIVGPADIDMPSFEQVAWHGTPHTVDRFTTAKIGTGEGNQAYGWGLYFAENENVAKHYRDRLSNQRGIQIRDLTPDERRGNAAIGRYMEAINSAMEDRYYDVLTPEQKLEVAKQAGDNYIRAARNNIAGLREDLRFMKLRITDLDKGHEDYDRKVLNIQGEIKSDELRIARLQDQIEESKLLQKRLYIPDPGNLYQVTLKPDEDEYLLWDETLFNQSDKVKQALVAAGLTSQDSVADPRFAKNLTGGEYYKAGPPGTANGSEKFSEMLHAAGIKGIKFLDGSSRRRPRSVFSRMKQRFNARMDEDAGGDEVLDALDEGGNFTPAQDRFLRALADDDWLGLETPFMGVLQALVDGLDDFAPSAELVAATEALKQEVGADYNYVIFADEDIEINGGPEASAEADDMPEAFKKIKGKATPDEVAEVENAAFQDRLRKLNQERAEKRKEKVGQFGERVRNTRRIARAARQRVDDTFKPIADTDTAKIASDYVDAVGVEAAANEIITDTIPENITRLQETAIAQETMNRLNDMILADPKGKDHERLEILFGRLAAAEGVNRRGDARALRYTTIEGKLNAATAVQVVDRIRDRIRREERAQGKKPKTPAKLPDEIAQAVIKIGQDTDRLRKLGKLTPLAQAIQAAKIADQIAKITPPTFWAKIRAIHTIGMLLNLKTMLRNIGGNTFNMLGETAAEFAAVPIDALVGSRTGVRTRTAAGAVVGLGKRIKGYGEPVRIYREAEQIEEILSNGAATQRERFSAGIKGIVAMGRANTSGRLGIEGRVGSTFKPGKGIRNAPHLAETGLSLALSIPDIATYQGAYDASLASQLDASKMAVPTIEMQDIATQDALRAIFQNETLLGKTAEKLKRGLNLVSTLGATHEFGAGERYLKFTRTPASILMRGAEFSPIGFAMAFWKDPGVMGARRFDQRRIVTAFSRAMVGSGAIAGLGFWMQQMGLLMDVGDEEDKDARALLKSRGQHGRQINFSALKRMLLSASFFTKQEARDGDVLMRYDWAQPIAIPFAMGATVGKHGAEGSLKAFGAGVKTLEDDPMLRGLADFSRTVAYAKVADKSFVTALGASVLQDMPSTFVPAQLAQINQTLIDTVQRDPWATQSFFGGMVDRVAARLPFASKYVKPSIDPATGEEVVREDTFGEPLGTMFALVDITNSNRLKELPVASELRELFSATGSQASFPRKTPRKIGIREEGAAKDTKIGLTPTQMRDLQQFTGRMTASAYDEIIATDDYQSMTPENRSRVLANTLSDIYTAGKVLVIGHRPSRVDGPTADMIDAIIQEDPGRYPEELKRWFYGD